MLEDGPCNFAGPDASIRTVSLKSEIRIEGMHCGSCAIDIRETLEEIEGVRSVDVTFERKTAIVEFEAETVPEAKIIDTIRDLGYEPSQETEVRSQE